MSPLPEDSEPNLLDDLGAMDELLESKKRPFIEIARELSQVQEEIRVQRVLFNPLLSGSGADLPRPASFLALSTYAHNMRRHLETWDPHAELNPTVAHQIVAAGSALYPLASTAYSEIIPSTMGGQPWAPVLRTRKQREDRAEIQRLLAEIEPGLADAFISAWQSLETPTVDPMRGPAYQMRHVLKETPREILRHLARMTYKEQPNRAEEQIRLIAERIVKNPVLKKQLQVAAKDYQKRYRQLCKVHKPGRLDETGMRDLLYAAQDLLALLLRSVTIHPDPESLTHIHWV